MHKGILMLCAPLFKTICGVRLLSASIPIDGKGMKNITEGRPKQEKLIMCLVLKMIGLLFFPDKILQDETVISHWTRSVLMKTILKYISDTS